MSCHVTMANFEWTKDLQKLDPEFYTIFHFNFQDTITIKKENN